MSRLFTEQECKTYSPDELAELFSQRIYPGKSASYPINPFQFLADLEIPYIFRSFSKSEGFYIPASSDDDLPVVGINLKRPVQRQRFTAAHELCHHLKDWNQISNCPSAHKNGIERYADAFASALLMPKAEILQQIDKFQKGAVLSLDEILEIAEYFGVSFEACHWRIVNIKPSALKGIEEKAFNKYKPLKRRIELGYSDVPFYRGIFDASEDCFKLKFDDYARKKFQTEYIYHDSRMEGIHAELDNVGDIVADLHYLKQESEFCREGNENIVELAGLSLVYDSLPKLAVSGDLSIFHARTIHRTLFSCAPHPEFGGKFKESNNLVLGAKFETLDAADVLPAFYDLDDEVQKLMDQENALSLSEYIERVVRIHHRLTVIHPFPEGNGRTSRAFTNLLLMHRGLPAVFFRYDKKGARNRFEKDFYKDALGQADQNGNYDLLYEAYYRGLLESLDVLTKKF